MSEPNSAPAASEGQTSEGDRTAFDAEFEAFLGHTFDVADDAGDEGSTPVEPETPAPADPPAGAEPKKDEGTGTEQPNADTPAGTETPPPAQPDPEIDPADLAAFNGLSQTAPATAEKPAAEAPASDAPEADEPYAPFQPTFKLRPEMSAAIFESEDTAVREQALVGLLSSFGNAVMALADQRIKEYHAPRLTAAIQESMTVRQAAAAVDNHFYGTYGELAQYKPAVQRAFKVIADKDPKLVYSPELAQRVAKLATQGLRAAGINVSVKALEQAKPADPPAAAKASKEKAPGSGFEAGSARPDMGTSSQMTPESLVNDLLEF